MWGTGKDEFTDGEPACVNILRRSTRSSWIEARLTLEVAEVRRLLASGATNMQEEQRSGVTEEVLAGLSSQELRNIDLAALASKGLRCLQRMVRGDGVPQDVLKKMLHSMRNILVLSCALELSEEHFAQMGCQGMPAALKERISSVLLREYSVDEIDDVMKCLGTAKYQVFNPCVHFSRRPRRVRPVATPSAIESSRISVSGLAAEKQKVYTI